MFFSPFFLVLEEKTIWAIPGLCCCCEWRSHICCVAREGVQLLLLLIYSASTYLLLQQKAFMAGSLKAVQSFVLKTELWQQQTVTGQNIAWCCFYTQVTLLTLVIHFYKNSFLNFLQEENSPHLGWETGLNFPYSFITTKTLLDPLSKWKGIFI